ncbi:hypothetical protein DOT_1438 [Desulfosporosinus sp. OT]|nr:hypothetical protein DOT_1438 [Desulfosporosinus sp. OT]
MLTFVSLFAVGTLKKRLFLLENISVVKLEKFSGGIDQ